VFVCGRILSLFHVVVNQTDRQLEVWFEIEQGPRKQNHIHIDDHVVVQILLQVQRSELDFVAFTLFSGNLEAHTVPVA